MKKLFTFIALVCLVNLFLPTNFIFSASYRRATLTDGKIKQAVTIGTIEEKYLFAKGFHLLGKGLGSAIPVIPALYESSIASPIGATDVTMTLVKGTDRSGNALSGFMCFTLDGGTPSVEYVCGTVAGTAVTAMTRGIDPITGVTTVVALELTHRRGADVKVTDYPVLSILARIINGDDTFPNKLTYSNSLTFSGSDPATTLMPKSYVDAGFNKGAATGTESTPGIWRGATRTQMSSSTGSIGNYNLLLQSQYSTSTSQVATSSIVVTQPTGKIDPSFLSSYPPTGAIEAYATSTAPSGWLLCDGSSLSAATYATLFAIIGYSYGGGSSNFTLPDLRGRQIIMATSTLGNASGASTTLITTSNLPASSIGSGIYNSGGGTGAPVTSSANKGSEIQTEPLGSGTPLSIEDPYLTLNYIIKY